MGKLGPNSLNNIHHYAKNVYFKSRYLNILYLQIMQSQLIMELLGYNCLKILGIIRVGQAIWTYSKPWAKNAKSMIHILQLEFCKEMKQLIHH